MNKNDTLAAYSDFTKWCRDNRHLDLDSRPHSHGGPIGDGGYISDEKTRVAFAAWRAAIEADRKHFAETLSALSGDAAGMYEQECDSYFNGLSDGYDYAAQVLRGEEKNADRQARGEPVAYGIKAANTGEIVTVLYGSDVDQVGEYRADLVVPLYTAPQPAESVRSEPVELDRYDAGLLGGQDGMPAYVWHDIIRAELDRAYDFYMDQIDRAAPQPDEPVATVRHFHYEGIARNGPSQEAVMIDGAPMLPEGTQLYTAPQPQQPPEGYKLVPIKSTREMQRAGAQAAREYMQETGGNSPAVIYEAMLEAAPHPPSHRQISGCDWQGDETMKWIDPNDKTQEQHLPWIGEPVLFCADGVTYYGKHTCGSFTTGQGVTQKSFDTWSCYWMYPPKPVKVSKDV